DRRAVAVAMIAGFADSHTSANRAGLNSNADVLGQSGRSKRHDHCCCKQVALHLNSPFRLWTKNERVRHFVPTSSSSKVRQPIEKSPASAGLFCLPLLAAIPTVDFFFRLVLCITIALLQTALELVLLACNNVKVIVSELSPLFLDLAFHFL